MIIQSECITMFRVFRSVVYIVKSVQIHFFPCTKELRFVYLFCMEKFSTCVTCEQKYLPYFLTGIGRKKQIYLSLKGIVTPTSRKVILNYFFGGRYEFKLTYMEWIPK